MVSVCREPEELCKNAPTITDHDGSDPVLPVHDVVPPSIHTANLVGPNIVNASEAGGHDSAAMERATTAVARLKCYDGTVVDNVTAVISSDLCVTILGYVDKVIQLGDMISQVLLITSLFNRCLQ